MQTWQGEVANSSIIGGLDDMQSSFPVSNMNLLESLGIGGLLSLPKLTSYKMIRKSWEYPALQRSESEQIDIPLSLPYSLPSILTPGRAPKG